MSTADLLLAATAAAAVLDWFAVSSGRRPLEWIAKPATLALLLLWAALGPGASWELVAALTFSLLGDVYLMLPGNLFAAGLGAFLVGHLFYIAAFDPPPLATALWLVGVLFVSAPVTLRILRAVPGTPLRVAVTAYMLVIAVMVASAAAAGGWIAVAGALLFMFSDSMIAWNRFVRPFALARPAIIVTYHVGQLLLVWVLRG
jgi:uncharacterized membrane protein YhhN